MVGSYSTRYRRKELALSPNQRCYPALALERSVDTISSMILPARSRNGRIDTSTLFKAATQWWESALLCFLLPILCVHAGDERTLKPSLKALFIDGGGYHDYEKLTPYLTSHISQLVGVTFEVRSGL